LSNTFSLLTMPVSHSIPFLLPIVPKLLLTF
jgi:hypothetical protein